MATVGLFFLPPAAMSSSLHNLTLDEQSFQGLLAAAFIIQEHNDRRKLAQPAPAESEDERVGEHCGAVEPADGSRSESSGEEEFRPGERLQRNWASMWLMSQERGLWPERSAEIGEAPQADLPPVNVDAGRSQGTSKAVAELLPAEVAPADLAPEDWTGEDADLTVEPVLISAGDEFSADVTSATSSLRQRIADWQVKLRFRRADLYLGTAVFVAALALLWPVAGSPRRAPLSPWERALVTLGIAEAPAPVIHLQGDPGISVWVDPHTALYYCPGEEQFGRTADGRMSSQREAQMDRFEPAGRSACE